MNDQTPWGQPTTAMAHQPPATGLTAEVMAKLEEGGALEPRARVTNTATIVLGALALVVATFSVGAWVGRDRASTTSSNSTAAPAANAFSAAASGATGRFGRGNAAAGAPGSGATGAGGFAGAGAGTAGTVKLVDGTNVYIVTADGTVVKVTTGAASQITVTKQGTVGDLAVGETVIVQGDAAADGTVAATAIRSGIGAAGGFGGAAGRAATATAATGATSATGR